MDGEDGTVQDVVLTCDCDPRWCGQVNGVQGLLFMRRGVHGPAELAQSDWTQKIT